MITSPPKTPVSSNNPFFPQISYFFRQDGHQLSPAGRGRWKCICPFYPEKKATCTLYDEGTRAGTFHCYGCGANASVYDYLMQYRSMDLIAARAEVLTLLSRPQEEPRHLRHLPPTCPGTSALAAPLSHAQQLAWLADCRRLHTNPAEISRIAEWRGFEETLVHWAAGHQHIGLRPASGRYCYGRVREAFPVRRPLLPGEITTATDYSIETSAHIGTHICLGPGTPGNLSSNNSYHFDPPGIGSWPLVIGDPATAIHILFIEGQWDALALVQLLGWHTHPIPPSSAAIIAFRGAANWRLWLAHQPLRKEATAYLFSVNDPSGLAWIQHTPTKYITYTGPTFVESLTRLPNGNPRIAAIHTITIPGGETDLNDALRKGLTTSSAFCSALPSFGPHPRSSKSQRIASARLNLN